MFPDIDPTALSSMSSPELAALLDETQRLAGEMAAGGELSADQLAELERVADGAGAIRAEQAARDARRDEALARIGGPGGGADGASAVAAAATGPVAARRSATAPPLNTLPSRAPSSSGSARSERPGVTLVDGHRHVLDGRAEVDAGALRQIRDLEGDRSLAGRFVVASAVAEYPADRVLGEDPAVNARRIEAVVEAMREPASLTAAGGLCAPVAPYYEILTIAEAIRPVRDALPSFLAARGGVRTIPPPRLADVGDIARTVADGVTNSTTTVTSATAAFTSSDVGGSIAGSGIPAGAYIVQVTNATTVIISAAATASATGVALTITRPGSVGYITAAKDSAALGGTAAQIVAATKPFVHVSCGTPVEFDVAAVTLQLEFGNLTGRAYPEQVQAWTTLALAQQARRAETALLDTLAANSTQVTAAKTVGAARQLIAQVAKAAAAYRNRQRMSPQAILDVLMPAWVLDLAVADIVQGSGYELEFLSQARQDFVDGLANAYVRASFYVDSGTGKGQLHAAQTAGALNTFPSTCVWYLFAPGSFLFLDGGQLDLGIVRDSTLNATNSYRYFTESFEIAAYLGVESLEVTSTVVADGTYSPAGSAPGSF